MSIYILVGDEASARLFRTEAKAKNKKTEWTLINSWEHPASRAHTVDMITDRLDEASKMPPRFYEGVRFAKQLGDYLNARSFEFDRLVLVGPPRFVGEVRKELSAPVSRKLTDTITKHLAQLKERDLVAQLGTQSPFV